MTVTKDDRVAVVAALLKSRNQSNLVWTDEEMAKRIIEALDQRALSTKWEGKRPDLLDEAQNCWIPHEELLEHLNALPGSPLTMADLTKRMQEYQYQFRDGDPSDQADCLRIYYREKQAGTEISAIIHAIYDEVVFVRYNRERVAKSKNRKAKLKELVGSGRDFGFIKEIDPVNINDYYSRHQGQLHRLIKRENGYELYCVDDVGDQGKPAKPQHWFNTMTAARDAVRSPYRRKTDAAMGRPH